MSELGQAQAKLAEADSLIRDVRDVVNKLGIFCRLDFGLKLVRRLRAWEMAKLCSRVTADDEVRALTAEVERYQRILGAVAKGLDSVEGLANGLAHIQDIVKDRDALREALRQLSGIIPHQHCRTCNQFHDEIMQALQTRAGGGEHAGNTI